MNNFENEIKYIESELIALKTAKQYSSTRNVNISSYPNINTGLYLVTYEKSEFISNVYPGYITGSSNLWGSVYQRTPSGNTQVIEVDTTTSGNDPEGPRDDNYITLTIISSVKVMSVQKIS